MRITAPPAAAPPLPKPDKPPPLTAEDVFDVTSRVTIADIMSSGRGVGNVFKSIGKHTENVVSKVLDLDPVDDQLSSGEESAIERGAEIVAHSLGYAAAGIQGLGGVYKLLSHPEKRDATRIIDGTYDIARSVASAAAVADLGAYSVLSPLATGFGGFRGVHRYVTGRKKDDERMQADGLLQTTRSTSTLLHVLGGDVAPLEIASKVLVPVAGAFQVGRGYHDLSAGLKADSNKKELWGLTDIAKGVGWTLACSGLAPLPGVVLTAAADVSRIAYQVSPRARKRFDRGLDKAEPFLKKVVKKTDKVMGPIERRLEKILLV